MRVVRANSSLVHSGNKTKKNTRTVLETASGQNVSEHNISARAHIVVNPRKARPPKACSKPESAPDKAAHKKKAVRKRKEEDDDESPDDEKEDESAISYAVGVLTRHLKCPTYASCKAASHVLNYLSQHPAVCIRYSGSSLDLHVSSDSD